MMTFLHPPCKCLDAFSCSCAMGSKGSRSWKGHMDLSFRANDSSVGYFILMYANATIDSIKQIE